MTLPHSETIISTSTKFSSHSFPEFQTMVPGYVPWALHLQYVPRTSSVWGLLLFPASLSAQAGPPPWFSIHPNGKLLVSISTQAPRLHCERQPPPPQSPSSALQAMWRHHSSPLVSTMHVVPMFWNKLMLSLSIDLKHSARLTLCKRVHYPLPWHHYC